MHRIAGHVAFRGSHALHADIGCGVVAVFAVNIENQRQKVFGFISGVRAKSRSVSHTRGIFAPYIQCKAGFIAVGLNIGVS